MSRVPNALVWAVLGAAIGAAGLSLLTLLEQQVIALFVSLDPSWIEHVRSALPVMAIVGSILGGVTGGAIALCRSGKRGRSGWLCLLCGGLIAIPLAGWTLYLTGLEGEPAWNVVVQAMLALYGLPLLGGLLLMVWGSILLAKRQQATVSN